MAKMQPLCCNHNATKPLCGKSHQFVHGITVDTPCVPRLAFNFYGITVDTPCVPRLAFNFYRPLFCNRNMPSVVSTHEYVLLPFSLSGLANTEDHIGDLCMQKTDAMLQEESFHSYREQDSNVNATSM